MNRWTFLFVAALSPLCVHGQAPQQALSLREALAAGLANSPELRAVDAEVVAARGRFWSGISLPPPELSIAHEYIPTGAGLASYTERTIGISQSFEFPTNYIFKSSVLASGQDVARAEAQHARSRVCGKIRSAYFTAWAAGRRAQYARETLALAESILAKTEVRARLGEAPPLERLTVRVQRSEAQHELMAARSAWVSACAELSTALGTGGSAVDTTVVLTDSLALGRRPANVDSLIALAESRNPELDAARARIRGASASRVLSWSSLLPSFTASYFRQAKDGVSDYYGASLGISVPLWFMLDTRGKVEEAGAGLAIAEAEFDGLRNRLVIGLRSAVNAMQEQENSVRLFHAELIPQAEEVSHIASRGYAAGELSYLEYLQAKVTLLATRRNYIDTLLEYLDSMVLLDELTGETDLNTLHVENR
jgi:outer membrane protein, heavy metal efflux system